MMAKPDLLAVNGIDLRPFLKKDWTPTTRKYDLDTPWISYGRVNASDDRIYVAVDAPLVKVTSRDRRRPPVRKRLSFPESGTWLPWPTMHRTVDKCGRTLAGHAIVAAGFGMLDEFYADAIARLPNVEYQPPTDHEKPIYFRFTGGWGAVMEIIPPEEDKPEQAAANGNTDDA